MCLGSGSTGSHRIPDKELNELMIHALRGNGEAASRVAIHFIYGTRDETSGFFWDTIGAENGNLEATYGLVIRLLNNKNNKDMFTRGIFWLYKMAAIGYRDTEKWLGRVGYSLETAKPPDDRLFPFNYTTLSEEEIIQCNEGALQGSGKAALILAQYYNEIARDIVSAEYWYRIGAQNGSTECQYFLGQIMKGKIDELDQIRGEFWLRRAEENGYTDI